MTNFSTNLISDEPSLVKARATSFRARRRSTVYTRVFKRALDVALVLTTGLITVPFVALLALAIVLTGQSPFYVQKRVGKDRKVFRMWKLRTMLPNAEMRLEAYLSQNPEARVEWDTNQKLKNDPRITSFGNWLRKTSFDELPQLFNVLNGTMSIVGPRPMMLDQQEQYNGTGYYNLRPGMTGLWQVSDRNSCSFAGRVRFDETYNRCVSFATDVNVIMKTVGVVLRGTGI